MTITVFDGIVIAILCISALLAMLRGFSREILSILAWVLSGILSYYSCPYLVGFSLKYIHNKTVAVFVTLFLFFLISLVVISLITIRLSEMVTDSRIGPVDRLLGVLYGVVRGWFIAVISFMFLNTLIRIEQQPAWLSLSRLRPTLLHSSELVKRFFPEDSESILGWIKDRTQELSEPVSIPAIISGDTLELSDGASSQKEANMSEIDPNGVASIIAPAPIPTLSSRR